GHRQALIPQKTQPFGWVFCCALDKRHDPSPVHAVLGAFCLPGEAGKPGHLKEDGVTPTEGKTIRLARASLANGGV
ncbi:hypothetical protein, partial [Vreelandella aquamarina]|uniref:hypothetical protein n=1 Tax=Vreelandella aquamarina TaxID=77097 RepID=UPI001D192F0E